MNRPGRLGRWVRGCPPGWQITRAVSEDGPFAAHIESCPFCAAEYQRLREVVVRAGVLAASDVMSHEARQAISARLLSGDRRSPVNRWRFLARPLWLAPLGVAALGIAWVVWGVPGTTRRGPPADTAIASAPAATSPSPTSALPSTPAAATAMATAVGSRASIRAVDAARFTRIAPPPDERIHLQEGVITLDVVALPHGERFRVVTEDAEVEVRGTHFEVSASRGRLVAVRVTNGRVQVMSTGGALATLDAGDEWVGGAASAGLPTALPHALPARTRRAADPTALAVAREPEANASGSDPAARLGPPPVASSSAAAAVPGPKTTDDRPPSAPERTALPRARDDRRDDVGKRHPTAASSFDGAWALLRKGDTRAAAAAFAEVERVAAGSALEEDASYWRAVAVARSGDADTARRLFGEFLRRFPASARQGEASVALGWLLLEAGQSGDARTAFERAASDPSEPVRARAREGLGRATGR